MKRMETQLFIVVHSVALRCSRINSTHKLAICFGMLLIPPHFGGFEELPHVATDQGGSPC